MERSLFLLLLMGQCSFSMCQQYEYHFVNVSKNWSEAQTYCRTHFTDLARVENITDLDRLCTETNCEKGWIGLYTESNFSGKWLWFNGRDGLQLQNCVVTWKDLYLGNFTYSKQGDSNYDCDEDELSVGTNVKSWLEVQKFYSESNETLRILPNQTENGMICETCESRLLSLFNDTWRWSDRSYHSERSKTTTQGAKKTQCVVMDEDGGWKTESCENQKPFYCYEDELVLVQDQKTWEEAWNYCRTNFHDLASITNSDQQKWVQKRAQRVGSNDVWVGLDYNCGLDLWFWVSNELVCYQNWAPDGQDSACTMAGAVERETSNWKKMDKAHTLNFICSKKTQA